MQAIRLAIVRFPVIMTQHYGMRKARYLGLARNPVRFGLMYVAYNMKRGLSIQQDSSIERQE